MSEVVWRPAVKADRPLLERFQCTTDDGPDYERLVERYFRVQAIPHLGAPDSRRADQRLLLILDGEVVVAAGCHRRGSAARVRNFVFAAVELGHQGGRLSDGQRASDVLWQMIVNDMLARPGDPPSTIIARVHPDNARSLRYCQRIGLLPGEQDSHGLVICSGPVIAGAAGPAGG